MNVIFLDYDGVVNTPMWSVDGKRCTCNFPEDNQVNNFQAVQWVSEFFQKYEYAIVVSSSWRFEYNYKDCLTNGGLRSDVEILGKTPYISCGNRGLEIKLYLLDHPNITRFLIFDDEAGMGALINHLVKCNPNVGFGIDAFHQAEALHREFENARVYGLCTE